MAAVRDGKSVDTTMGFSPAGGLVMGTRLGDVDPGLLVHWLDGGDGGAKRDARALEDLVNRRSGLLGISETTADVRDLLGRRAGDPRAALALDVFTWSARKWVGAMTAALGGLDTLVFTGGIGEHSSPVRAEIARGLEHLGVRIDDERNARSEAIVEPGGGRVHGARREDRRRAHGGASHAARRVGGLRRHRVASPVKSGSGSAQRGTLGKGNAPRTVGKGRLLPLVRVLLTREGS